jgi:hypothetical protein
MANSPRTTERGTVGTACELGKRVMTRPSMQKLQRRDLAATAAVNGQVPVFSLGTSD